MENITVSIWNHRAQRVFGTSSEVTASCMCATKK